MTAHSPECVRAWKAYSAAEDTDDAAAVRAAGAVFDVASAACPACRRDQGGTVRRPARRKGA